MSQLSDPGSVMRRLAEIENELALTQNDLEEAAFAWFRARPERERVRLVTYASTEGTAPHRKIAADAAALAVAVEEEARYEVLRSKQRTLADRASIGQSILRAQGRS